jgi:hypothetical protein
MAGRRHLVHALVLLVTFGMAVSTHAQSRPLVKHSGIIVDVHDRAGTFVLAEVGPWRVENGETVVVRRTIALAPDTTFAIVKRTKDVSGGFSGDFVESRLDISEVFVGDHVTVECRREGARLIAARIVVTDIPRP